MRVFAIAHFLAQNAADDAVTRRGDIQRFGKPVGDHRIVGGGTGKSLGGHALAEIIGRLAGIAGELRKQLRIIGGIGQRRYVGVVLAEARIIAGPPISIFSTVVG